MLVEDMILLPLIYFCVLMENILSVSVIVVVPKRAKPQWYEMRVHQNDKEIYQVFNK